MASIKDGDYRVVGAVRSGSDINRWYPVALDLKTPNHPSGAPKLSCHCPAWTKNVGGQKERVCKHTEPFAALIKGQRPDGLHPARPTLRAGAEDVGEILGYNPALAHIQGNWAVQEFEAPLHATKQGRIVEEDYHWWLMRVTTGDLTSAAGIVAVPADGVPNDPRILKQTLAAWAGYQIAAEFLIRAGQRPGEPPAHFRDEGRAGKRAKAIAGELADGGPGGAARLVPPPAAGVPKYGIGDLMVAMNDTDQGDGRLPKQRAEELLKIMLGDAYKAVDPTSRPYRGYLDAPSKNPQADLTFIRRHASYQADHLRIPERCQSIVYRIRVDAGREFDRRVRIWFDGRYLMDLCIVREGYYNSKVPVADAFLSRYLGFLTNPHQLIGMANVFGPRSDQYYGDDRYGEEPPVRLHA